MPQTQVRVVGSGFTVLSYNGKGLAWCEGFEDSGQQAWSDLGQSYQFIQPIGARHPKEIATSRVLQGATLMLTLRELWNQPVWWQLNGLAQTYNIVDIYEVLARNPNYVTAQMIIKPPGTENQPAKWRGKVYHNVTPVLINDADTVTVGALSVPKGITCAYTHSSPLRR